MFNIAAFCMHCGVALDVFAKDIDGLSDCIADNGDVCIHDYDTEYPFGDNE